jgi:hypothetical protein
MEGEALQFTRKTEIGDMLSELAEMRSEAKISIKHRYIILGTGSKPFRIRKPISREWVLSLAACTEGRKGR